MKKFLAVLLAAMMVLSMTASFAEEAAAPAEKGTIVYGATTEIGGDFAPGPWYTNNATDKTNDNRGQRCNKTSCWCDSDKTSNAAGSCTENGRFAVEFPFSQYPGNGSSGSRSLGGYKCIGSQSIGAESTAGVEAEPAEPEKRSAENGHWQVVWNHSGMAIAFTFAQQDAESKSGNTGENVDDETTGKIQRTEFCQEATAPYPMCHGVVNQDGPEENKDGKSGEFIR